MFKTIFTLLLLINLSAVPLTPNPARVYFKKDTSIQDAATLIAHYDIDQFFTNFPGNNGRTGGRGFYFRNLHSIQFQSDEYAFRADLNTLTSAQSAELEANPMIDHIQQTPQLLAPAFFFLRKILGLPK